MLLPQYAIDERAPSTSRFVEQLCGHQSAILGKGYSNGNNTNSEVQMRLFEWPAQKLRSADGTYAQSFTVAYPSTKGPVLG